MKKTQRMLLALILALSAGTAGAADNIAVNSGFEESPGMNRAEGWQGDNPAGYGTFAGIARTGIAAYKAWAQPALWQEFPARAGDTWKASAWFLHPAESEEDQPLSGGAFARIRLEFKNADHETLHAEHSETLNEQDATNEWKELEVKGRVPLGAVYARVVLNIVYAGGQGVVYVDDVEIDGPRR